MPAGPVFLHKNDGTRSGKVRDMYAFGQYLLIVSSDRISAFDHVLSPEVPGKGQVLNSLSTFWFRRTENRFPNHLITDTITEMANFDPRLEFGAHSAQFQGRCMLVHSADVIPFECVVRGYLAGSGWKEYCEMGTVCGIQLPPGLRQGDQLPEPIFTPATKAETGHDINISFKEMQRRLHNDEVTELLRTRSLTLYREGEAYARECGIIIADTKFEWGYDRQSKRLLLIDELFTPDSSRFWPIEQWQPGREQPSYDKQYVRDWLIKKGWDTKSDPPILPADVIQHTRAKYIQAYELLTHTTFPWK